MKRGSFILCLFLSLQAISQPNTWVQKTNFGGSARYGASEFSIGNYGYIGLGWDGSSYKNDLWEYDTGNNSWTQKANFLGQPRHGASSFSIGIKGYVGTGLNGSTRFDDFWEYNSSNNIWAQKTNFPGTARYDAAGISIGSKGYIGTGTWGPSGPMYNDFYEYDTTNNIWTQKAPFPGNIRNGARGFTIGNFGYIGLGSDVNISTCYADLYMFDPSNNLWTQKANFPGNTRAGYSTFVLCSKGFVVAGAHYSSMVSYNDLWEYSPISNTWAQRASFGGQPRGWCCGFTIGTKGYVGAGYNGSTFYNDFWEYTAGGSVTASINSSASSICAGQSATLTASGGSNYSWSTGATNTSIAVAPSFTSTYSVIVTDFCGSDTVAATVTIAYVSLDPGNAISICLGDSTLLSGGGNVTSYTWSPSNSLANPYIPQPIAFPSVTTTYTVTGTNSIGCMAVDSQVVTVLPVPSTPTFSVIGNSLSSSSTSGNQWYLNGSPITGETGQFHNALVSGSYQVAVTDSNGCSAISAPFSLVYNAVSDIHSELFFSVSSNHVEGVVVVRIRSFYSHDITVFVTDFLGRNLIMDNIFIHGDLVVRYPISNFSPGMYLMQFITDGKIHSHKFVISE